MQVVGQFSWSLMRVSRPQGHGASILWKAHTVTASCTVLLAAVEQQQQVLGVNCMGLSELGVRPALIY